MPIFGEIKNFNEKQGKSIKHDDTLKVGREKGFDILPSGRRNNIIKKII